MLRRMLLCGSALALLFGSAFAEFPRQISFQSLITDDQDQPVNQLGVPVEFRLFDAQANGTEVWNEGPVNKAIQDGLLHHYVGSTTALPDSVFTHSAEVWLELEVDGEIIQPRTRLVASGFAFRVATVDSANGGTLVGDIKLRIATDSTAMIELAPSDPVSDGGLMYMRNGEGEVSVFMDANPFGSNSGYFDLRDETGSIVVSVRAHEVPNGGGKITIKDRYLNPKIILDADDPTGDARITTEVLEITGGSDLSEQFAVSAHAVVEPQPGMVVCIDPAAPGQLIVSEGAYNPTVAGIISGAGGVKTGLYMGQRESLADGAHPVALTGRVYCLADASNGAIQPGDLLTTSPKPGHAMKVSDRFRAQGAILGKAMTSLHAETGLVLVLVTLQ